MPHVSSYLVIDIHRLWPRIGSARPLWRALDHLSAQCWKGRPQPAVQCVGLRTWRHLQHRMICNVSILQYIAIHVYIYICLYIVCIYIYIYINYYQLLDFKRNRRWNDHLIQANEHVSISFYFRITLRKLAKDAKGCLTPEPKQVTEFALQILLSRSSNMVI